MVKCVTETPMTQMLTNVHELINKEWTGYERDTTFSYRIMVTPRPSWYAISLTLCLLGPFSLQWHLSQFRLYILIFSSTQAKSKYVWIQWKKLQKLRKNQIIHGIRPTTDVKWIICIWSVDIGIWFLVGTRWNPITPITGEDDGRKWWW